MWGLHLLVLDIHTGAGLYVGLFLILNFELAVPIHFKIGPQAKDYGVPLK
jgi:hypothetical protein